MGNQINYKELKPYAYALQHLIDTKRINPRSLQSACGVDASYLHRVRKGQIMEKDIFEKFADAVGINGADRKVFWELNLGKTVAEAEAIVGEQALLLPISLRQGKR